MNPSPDLAVRLARAAFNRALAECDLGGIGSVLSPDVVMVTGTDSAIVSGRKAQLAAWKREFASPERITYIRMPESVTAAQVEPIALEQGRWRGVVAATGAEMASGLYSAKWRRIDSVWMIEAEIFATLA